MKKTYADICIERAEKSTIGPWTNDWNDDGCLIDSGGIRLALTDDRDYASFDSVPKQCRANAEFIAHARTDVPELASRLAKAIYYLKCVKSTEDKYGSTDLTTAIEELEAPLEGEQL